MTAIHNRPTINMRKFIGSIKNKKGSGEAGHNQSYTPPRGDGPDAIVVREVTAFCEAGAPGAQTAGDEYLHLPAIVDAAEGSPSAAREAAACLRRYLSKDNFSRGYLQYNAIMLARILTDNPGRGFTQNFDKTFVSTVKDLLRESRDGSVQQIMRETLDYLEAEKLDGNETLMPLVEMWRKEKGKSAGIYQRGSSRRAPPPPAFSQQHQQPRQRGLPPPDELAARIEEARTSARLLVQMVQSTPTNEFLGNELIKEFAERARQASKSIQNYMACENPSPDEETMLTLIETSEQLNIAASKHSRAQLAARKAVGQATPTPSPQAHTNESQDPFSTWSLQTSLPQQPLRAQQMASHRGEYGAHASHGPDPYANLRETERTDQYSGYAPPSGPPPGARTANASGSQHIDSTQHERYAPPPLPPPRAHAHAQSASTVNPTPATSQKYNGNIDTNTSDARTSGIADHSVPPLIPTASHAYEVGENPFADDVYTAPQQNSYSLFNKGANQLRSHHSPPLDQTPAQELPHSPPRSYPPSQAQTQGYSQTDTYGTSDPNSYSNTRSHPQPPSQYDNPWSAPNIYSHSPPSDSNQYQNASQGGHQRDVNNYGSSATGGYDDTDTGYAKPNEAMRRQESAMNNLTMHGASPPTPVVELDATGAAAGRSSNRQ